MQYIYWYEARRLPGGKQWQSKQQHSQKTLDPPQNVSGTNKNKAMGASFPAATLVRAKTKVQLNQRKHTQEYGCSCLAAKRSTSSPEKKNQIYRAYVYARTELEAPGNKLGLRPTWFASASATPSLAWTSESLTSLGQGLLSRIMSPTRFLVSASGASSMRRPTSVS